MRSSVIRGNGASTGCRTLHGRLKELLGPHRGTRFEPTSGAMAR